MSEMKEKQPLWTEMYEPLHHRDQETGDFQLRQNQAKITHVHKQY